MALTIENQTKISNDFYKAYYEVEKLYLERLAHQLRDIGTLQPSEFKQLEQLILARQNIDYINAQLAILTAKSVSEVNKLLTNIATENYKDMSKFYLASGTAQPSINQNKAIKSIIEAVSRITNGTMKNISNSTAVSEAYLKAIDKGILAINTGVADYQSVLRAVLREQAEQGIQYVEYSTGKRRNVASAVRMNVMDGMHQVNMQVANQAGEEFGYDGVQITSHANPAPDHLDIDGIMVSNERFEAINSTLKRRVATMNCYHITQPVLMDISTPLFTDEELAERKKNNLKKHSYGNKSKTRYEWSQVQRRMEKAMSKNKELIHLAKIVGDKQLELSARNKHKLILSDYKAMSKAVGLDLELNRVV